LGCLALPCQVPTAIGRPFTSCPRILAARAQ